MHKRARELLLEIPGIGPETVSRYISLLREHGADVSSDSTTIKQLRGALVRLPDEVFKSKLPVLTQADLLFQPLRRIPRSLIDFVDCEFKRCNKGIRFDIAGSYRRGKPVSGDLDIVVSARGKNKRTTWESFTKNINTCSRKVRIMPAIAGHEDKITVLFRVCLNATTRREVLNCLEPYHIRSKIEREGSVFIKADVFLTRPREYVFALLFVTGSGKFNVRMRRQAKLRGYKLNQYGLFRNGKQVDIKNERELFALLGMRYRKPVERRA